MEHRELLKVEPNANSNKFYRIQPDAAGATFTATWGRVGSKGQSMQYPASQYNAKLGEKLGKGYRDVTALKAVGGPAITFSDLSGSVASTVAYLMAAAKASVTANYTVSETVTAAQVAEAQAILDRLGNLNGQTTVWAVNRGLTELWTVLPRKMRRVQDELLTASASKAQIAAKLRDEQDLLDRMAAQVSQAPAPKVAGQTILDAAGIQMWEATDAQKAEVMGLVEPETKRKIARIWRVKNAKTQAAFEAWKPGSKVRLLFHGSKDANWWPIMSQGLKIRPAATNGSMFGRGLYFASKADKSIGYTDLSGSRWAHGNSGKAFMAVYAVKMGKTETVTSARGDAHRDAAAGRFDSIWAKAGNSLINDEFIVYSDAQATIAYLIELKA